MPDELIFPAKENFSRIPENFRCYDVLLERKNPLGNEYFNFASFFFVDSPAEWAISRTEDYREPEHVDIFFILSGSICYQSGAGKGRAHPGQVMLVPSWLNRIIFQDESSTHIYIRLDGNYARFEISELAVYNFPNIDEVKYFTRILLKKNSLAAGNQIYRRNILENLNLLLYKVIYPGDNKDSPEKISRLLDYLHKEYPGKLSVAGVAKKFGMSLSKFRQFCLKNFSKSPNALLDDIRMSRARALLSYSDLTIDAIAAELGYSSRFAFSKAFYRINHITPGKFKRN